MTELGLQYVCKRCDYKYYGPGTATLCANCGSWNMVAEPRDEVAAELAERERERYVFKWSDDEQKKDRGASPPSSARQKVRKRWEYCRVYGDNGSLRIEPSSLLSEIGNVDGLSVTALANLMGTQGWEVISVTQENVGNNLPYWNEMNLKRRR